MAVAGAIFGKPASALPRTVVALRVGTAAVWLLFGLVFKVLDVVPRHRLIVASVLGEAVAGPVTMLVGAAEVGLAMWILTGFRPRVCAAVQTMALAAMNGLELTFAREILLAPLPMVCANVAFLAAGWYAALAAPAASPGA